MGRWRNYISIW